MQWFMVLLVSPITASFLLLSLVGGRNAFAGFSQFFSLFPGKLGSYLRMGFYPISMRYCSKDAFIGFGVLFSQVDTDIHEQVYIGPQCNIGSCSIGKNSLLGSAVHIMSGKAQHDFSDLNTPIKDQGGQLDKVCIGEDCWIGNGALIMANIGNQCVIAAGAVVISDIPDFSIVAGNPARVIKSRKS